MRHFKTDHCDSHALAGHSGLNGFGYALGEERKGLIVVVGKVKDVVVFLAGLMSRKA